MDDATRCADLTKDITRIDVVLELIRQVWKKHPDLRLCQLIGNCFPAGDNYGREDDDLAQGLIKTYVPCEVYNLQDKEGRKIFNKLLKEVKKDVKRRQK